MSWMLYGSETWLVAVLKGVPLFLFMYFVLFYIPNYVNTDHLHPVPAASARTSASSWRTCDRRRQLHASS